MEKAARNERRKISATFVNNIGVGLFLAGAFVPIYAILSSEWIVANGYVVDMKRATIGATGALAAIGLSLFLHREALDILSHIED